MKEQIDSKTPKIRFKGCSETWRTASVSSLLAERNVQTPKSEQYPLMAFIAGQGVAPKGKRYNREFLVSDELNKKYKQTELGDFIYSSNNLETGSIGTNNYGSASISPVYCIFYPTPEGDSSFIGQLLCKKAFINEMVKWRQGVVYGQWRIHESDFLKIKATFPTVDEQTKIGKYFRELDSLIGLHQRKHDKLVTLKKAMLQKMFPQVGATTPEIRFKGFSGDWVENTLKTAAEITTGFPFKSSDFNQSGTYLVITNGNIQNELTFVDASVGKRINIQDSAGLNQFLLRVGDILVTMDGSVGRTAKVRETNQILAQRVGRLVSKSDSEFLYQALNTGAFFEEMTTISHGGTIKHISLSEIGDYLFLVPSDLEEQQKIGTYLCTLDELIAKHAIQLNKLQQIKSACLEKMFV